MNNYLNQWRKLPFALFMLVLACCFAACDSEKEVATDGVYDPNRPVVVSGFTPAKGGVGQKLVIYGENFDTDTTKTHVTIGGIPAVVINAKSNAIYCFVPAKAYSGEVEVTCGNGDNAQTGTAPTKFEYEKKMTVGTLFGYRNQNDDQGWKDGTFETYAGIREDCFLKFDPLNHKHLYMAFDKADIQLVDLEKRTVKTVMSRSMFENTRIRSVDFTLDGKYMVVATDRDDRGEGRSPSVWIVTRNADGSFTNESPHQILASYMQCNGASIHPINGEMYFNSYQRGQVFQMDLNKYFTAMAEGKQWNPNWDGGNYKELFTIQDTGWEFQIHMHPSGKYAYIIVINQHYILRTDYNETEKRFAPPYIIAGQVRQSGYADGVGTDVRFYRPYQGCFVKNPDYVKEGRDDVYDFYICDNQNHCIRKMTPDGVVSTYAGRGSTTSVTDNNVWGTDDGDLRLTARFRDPTGIAYDEETNTFYVVCTIGRTMRTISMEK